MEGEGVAARPERRRGRGGDVGPRGRGGAAITTGGEGRCGHRGRGGGDGGFERERAAVRSGGRPGGSQE
jgi:hypothetical protein